MDTDPQTGEQVMSEGETEQHESWHVAIGRSSLIIMMWGCVCFFLAVYIYWWTMAEEALGQYPLEDKDRPKNKKQE